MATRQLKQKTDIDEETLSNAIALLDDESFSSESLNPALETLYAEMGILDGGEANVYVTMLDADGKGDEANIWRGTPDDYDLERLAKQFGSGKYRVKIYVRNPTGQRVLKANKVFTWKLTPEEEERRKHPQAAPQPAFNPNELSRMIAESIKAALPPPVPVAPIPVVDPLTQFKQFAEIMQMMQPPRQEVAPAQNTLSSLRDMAELMDMLRGGNDSAPAVGSATGNDLMLKLIDKFGPLFMNVLAAQQGQAAPTDQPQIAAPMQPATPYPTIPQPAQESTAVPAQPQATQEEVNDVNIRLKMGMNFLTQMCDSGGDPALYAEVVLDNVPEETVKALLASPLPLDMLGNIDARIKNEPYATWFTGLLAACKEALTDEETEPGEDHAKNT